MKKPKTIAGKIIAAFKNLFPDLIEKVYNDIEPELRQEISWITQIVSNINDVLQSGVVDILTAVIPGDADDDFVKWARIALPELISNFGIPNTGERKAVLSARIVKYRTGMELSEALIASQAVYEKESRPA